ncbi:MAG: SprT-like domain-containing protein [Nitrospirales bacterium]|nr:SprT-like domain-containing protein [Nitrospirales bacterium]
MKSSSSPRHMSLPSSDQIQQAWRQLSNRYFDDRLPPISIVWSSRLTASAGMFVSRVGPRTRSVPSDVRQGTARVIRLSAPLLREQLMEEVVRTLAHEMIHQWQFDIRHCRPSHGPDFLAKMHRMNHDGLGVSVYHHLDEAVQLWNRYAWRCVHCGCEYRRQRRTIKMNSHRCGQCGGSLKEIDAKGADIQKTEVNRSALEDSPPELVEGISSQIWEQLVLPF